jgi:heme-degrading monooxygenase HmoA
VAEFARHSVVLASDYRVPSVEEMWLSLQGRRSDFAGIGAHHVVVYASVWESGRVLVTIGVHNSEPLPDLLRSPVIFEWFDVAGVDDIPAVFAGEVVEKMDLAGPVDGKPPGVVVAALASVEDVAALLDDVHTAAERFTSAGLRKVWIYRAIDDGREVLILQEIADEAAARQWIDAPDPAAEWMTAAGRGEYPPVFVGRFAHMMTVDEKT